MSKSNFHGADGSFLGFLFQIERVLAWLSEGKVDVVGIETDDDVVAQIKSGKEIQTIYEQAKNTQTQRTAFSDQSEDLWKTLYIWITAVTTKKIDVNKAVFSAVTNKKIPISRLLTKLAIARTKDTENMDEALKLLKETAGKLSTKLKPYGDAVVLCDEKVLRKIINRIVVFDGSYHHTQHEYKKKIKANLSVGGNVPFDYVYGGLLGHIVEVILTGWRKREEVWIETKNFNNLYNQLLAEFHKKTFIELATEFLPVSKKDVEKNKQKKYVDQLKAIECDEEELLEAIHDFIRANSEKNRYAKEFEVTQEKFKRYYNDLKDHWKNISAPRFRARGTSKKTDVGYEVYYQSLLYKGKLNGQEPEQPYTYKGAYHHLSNNSDIGWHPDWEDLFKK